MMTSRIGSAPQLSQHCVGCKYHYQRMKRFSRKPVCLHFCEHPYLASPMAGFLKTSEAMCSNRYIGESSLTPYWCPADD